MWLAQRDLISAAEENRFNRTSIRFGLWPLKSLCVASSDLLRIRSAKFSLTPAVLAARQAAIP